MGKEYKAPDFDEWVGDIDVHPPGVWENAQGPDGWWAVSDDDGIRVYASTEDTAFAIKDAIEASREEK